MRRIPVSRAYKGVHDLPHKRSITRRTFLGASAAVLAGAGAHPTRLFGMTNTILMSARTRRTSPNAWLPEPTPAEQLRSLALVAMEAAKRAGADFADIRIGVQRNVSVPRYPYSPHTGLDVGYGVRAWVDGTWSFQHGNLLTTDAVATAARGAVAGARTYARVNAILAAAAGHGGSPTWAPAPAVTGEWRAPMELDPFLVPLDDYHRVLDTLVDTTADIYKNINIGCLALGWQAETRVFASTEGALVTQYLLNGGAAVDGSVSLPVTRDDPLGGIPINIPLITPSTRGFEMVLRSDLVSRLLPGVDDAVRLRELPFRQFRDVGRFPVVLHGTTAADLLGNVVSSALDGDRVSGLEADAAGTSYLTPWEEILGATTPPFSPLLTMTAGRAMPSPMAVGWDDDGVVPESYSLIEHGRVVDYHTTRETAPMLASWYERQGRPMRSHGSCVATTPDQLPMGSGGHVTVTPALGHASLDDLAREMTHGFIVFRGSTEPEPGLSAGRLGVTHAVEVQRGVPVAWTGLDLLFRSKPLLQKQLLALGDAETVRTVGLGVMKGIPWQGVSQFVTAPAMLCKDLDVVML